MEDTRLKAKMVKTPESWKNFIGNSEVPGCPNCGRAKDCDDVVDTVHTPCGNGTTEFCKCVNCKTEYVY